MENIYKFVVDSETFEKILSGKKTIQLAINSSKFKGFVVGNQITFEYDAQEEIENPSKDKNGEVIASVEAQISSLLYFADIKEAIETLGKEKCGFKPSQTIEKASDIFLSTEKYENVEKNGIVAISFEIIK